MDSLNKLSEISNWRFSTNDTQRVFGFIVSFMSHPTYAHSRHVVCLQKKKPSGGFNCAGDASYMEHNQPQGLSGPLIACVADVERVKGIGKKGKRERGRGERGREKLPSLSPLSCFSPFPSPSPFCACHALRRLVHSLKPRFYGPLSFRPFFWKLNCFVVFLVFHIVVLIHLELNGKKTLCLNAHPRGALENHTQFSAINGQNL